MSYLKLPRWGLGAVILGWLAGQTFAADDLEMVAVRGFTDACLMSEPSFEGTVAFSTQQDWKVLAQSDSDRHGTREATWQIGTSGVHQAILRLHAVIQPPNWDIFRCEVVLPGYRDTNKRIETAFKDEISRRPGATRWWLGRDMPDRKRLDYRDGPVVLSYYDGPLADPANTPWVLLSVQVDRKQK